MQFIQQKENAGTKRGKAGFDAKTWMPTWLAPHGWLTGLEELIDWLDWRSDLKRLPWSCSGSVGYAEVRLLTKAWLWGNIS